MDRQQLATETALYADTMTAQERQAAYARGEEADRLPTAVSVRGTMAPFYGYTQAQYRDVFAVRAEVYRQAETDFGCSGVAVGPNLHKMGIAMGAKPIVLPDMTEQLTACQQRQRQTLQAGRQRSSTARMERPGRQIFQR